MSEVGTALKLNEQFSKHVNSLFTLPLEDGRRLDLILRSCEVHVAESDRENFSLEFRGPLDAPSEQGVYRLVNEDLGEMDVFLVPIEKDSGGYTYEAVFNLLHR